MRAPYRSEAYKRKLQEVHAAYKKAKQKSQELWVSSKTLRCKRLLSLTFLLVSFFFHFDKKIIHARESESCRLAFCLSRR